MTDCDPFLTDDFRFPARPWNRPALKRIRYRIARYPDFVEMMERRINTAVELEGWTHRDPDDPAIALMQGAAIVGDILTFYQEHYANEAYLRTALWRESVSDLVRLYGYRLAPGLGGRATFAFEVKGTAPITVPKGLPLKADLENVEDPGEFETAAELKAWPHLSNFNLYRARDYASQLGKTKNTAEVQQAGGYTTAAAIADLDLKAGDRLMLIPTAPGWTKTGSTISTAQKTPQTLKVKKVEIRLGRTIVTFETPFDTDWTAPALAYRIGRSFRHFGHNAPKTYIENTTTASGKIDGARERDTGFFRHVDMSHACANTSASINLPARMIPLDSQVDDLAVKSRVVVSTRIRQNKNAAPYALTVVRHIDALRTSSIGFATATGPTTLVTLDFPLVEHLGLPDALADVRDYEILEVTSPPIRLRPEATASGGAFANGTDALDFYGTLDEVKALAGRRLILTDAEGGRSTVLTCTNKASDFLLPGGAADEAQMWPISFDMAPHPFTRLDFDEAKPTVTVYGNLIEATQGKAQTEVALGNGDARQRFQTFKLPKAPLTWLRDTGATPPYAPEVTIRVDGRAWRRVESLFGQSQSDEVYIVRNDADGEAYVQFGDGKTGARLPSGIKNVTAAYRVGTGAYGPAKAGSQPSAGRKVEGVQKVHLPGLVTGGDAPEAAGRARETAPGKVQSLGRLVSIRDFETEVLTIPGVTSASAAWGLDDGVPTLLLRVLMDRGREDEFQAVRATIATYQRCRGADRFPVAIDQARFRYAYLSLAFAFDPRLKQAEVETEIRSALGLADDEDAAWTGLFGQSHRRLGEKEYLTRIEGTVQQVTGVSWCKVTGLGMFAGGHDDPGDLTAPTAPQPVAEILVPAENELLALHGSHLGLTATLPDTTEACR